MSQCCDVSSKEFESAHHQAIVLSDEPVVIVCSATDRALAYYKKKPLASKERIMAQLFCCCFDFKVENWTYQDQKNTHTQIVSHVLGSVLI